MQALQQEEVKPRGKPGRPKGSVKKRTNRALREQELLMLLRKIKPHVSESIMTAARIMKNQEAAHTSQLKAATILLDAYKQMVNELYNGEDDAPAEEVQKTGAVFSLTVLNNDKKD